MPKSFIFDWSGTLSDSFGSVYWVLQKMFRELGSECPSADEVKLRLTVPYMAFWNHYFPDLTKERQDELYLKYIRQAPRPGLFPSVKELLGDLREAGSRLFIVSSDPPETFTLEVKQGGVEDLFEEIFPGIYQKEGCLRDLAVAHGLKPSESFYVGDTVGDIEAGRSAGMVAVTIAWGHQHKEVLAKASPDYLFDDLYQIKTLCGCSV